MPITGLACSLFKFSFKWHNITVRWQNICVCDIVTYTGGLLGDMVGDIVGFNVGLFVGFALYKKFNL